MKKKRVLFGALAVVLCVALTLSSCSFLESQLNSFKGSLVGVAYTADFYDNYGAKFFTASGDKIDINGNYVAYYTGCVKGADDGWLPSVFAKRNKYGIPWVLHTLFYIMAVIPNILGMEIGQLSSLASAVTIAPMAIPLWGLLKLPEKDKEAWESSIFSKIFKGKVSLTIFVAICSLALIVFVVINFINFTPMTLVLAIGYMVITTLIVIFFGDKIINRKKMNEATKEAAI